MTLSVMQIIIGIIAIIIAFKFIKKLAKSIFFTILGVGVFCISKGIIDIAMIQEWFSTIF